MTEPILKYRAKEVYQKDLEFIQSLIARHPESSRRNLSKLLCEAWDWVQPNGALKDMVCRGLMLQLHRAGHICLPEVRYITRNPFLERQKPERITEIDDTPIESDLKSIDEISIRQVRRGKDESFFCRLIETYHYLGYTQPVGEHLKYLVYSGERPIACMAWCSAVRHLASRDGYIGWSPETRMKNLHLIAYNTRYLILPWVRVPHLASHLLGRFSRRLSGDWEEVYGHPVHFLETFIEPSLYPGTCYRAANWKSMGFTTGRGKNDQTNKVNRPIKEVLGYPLRRDFKRRLCA